MDGAETVLRRGPAIFSDHDEKKGVVMNLRLALAYTIEEYTYPWESCISVLRWRCRL